MPTVLARDGNYKQIRRLFFEWRQLTAVTGKIPFSKKINEKEIEFIKQMRVKKEWKFKEAYDLLVIIQRFTPELKAYGIITDLAAETDKHNDLITNSGTEIKRRNFIDFSGEKFMVTFRYTKQMLQTFKENVPIGVRRCNREKKYWEVDIDFAKELKAFVRNYNKELKEFQQKEKFEISDPAENVIRNYHNNFAQSYSFERVDLEIPLKIRLYDYQTVGVDYGIRVKRMWLCDEMGLGKTPQAIATAVGINRMPVVIFCPLSLRYNWADEIHAWTDYKAVVATKKNMAKIDAFIEHGMCDFLIVNYHGAKTFFVDDIRKVITEGGQTRKYIYLNGKQLLFKGVIIDESHLLKNNRTDNWKIINKIVDHMEVRMLLTGTPIVNHVNDAVAQLELLGLIDQFGGAYKFKKDYNNINSKSFNTGSVTRDLNTRLRRMCLVRREKKQVLTELPEKVRRIVRLELSNRKEYDHAYINLLDWLAKKGASNGKIEAAQRAEMLVKMNYLSQLSAIGRIDDFCEWLKMMNDAGEKVIIFCVNINVIDLIKERFQNSVEISGRTDDDDIDRHKKMFQNDPQVMNIFITYAKGGFGHTLTAAAHVACYQMGWTPAGQDQAEDRAHRIGQKRNVTAHYFIGKDTVDERKLEIINQKRDIAEDAVDASNNILTVEEEMIKSLINKSNERKKDSNGQN